MLGIGIVYINLAQIINALSLQYVVLCALVVLGAIIGAVLCIIGAFILYNYYNSRSLYGKYGRNRRCCGFNSIKQNGIDAFCSKFHQDFKVLS